MDGENQTGDQHCLARGRPGRPPPSCCRLFGCRDGLLWGWPRAGGSGSRPSSDLPGLSVPDIPICPGVQAIPIHRPRCHWVLEASPESHPWSYVTWNSPAWLFCFDSTHLPCLHLAGAKSPFPGRCRCLPRPPASTTRSAQPTVPVAWTGHINQANGFLLPLGLSSPGLQLT